MKQCKTCENVKPLAEFYTNGKQPSGKQKYHPSCISCMEDFRFALMARKRTIITEMFGDKCSTCGYNKCFNALDFHHVDSSQKDYKPANIISNLTPITTMIKELEKCVMLCANCHREVHA